jgi:lactate racemase
MGVSGQKAINSSSTIPTRAWYGDEDMELVFPSGWDVTTLWPADAPGASQADIEAAFAHPIGTPAVAELAAGRKSAAIVVDDLSRPTPAAELLPFVLQELGVAGIPRDEIRIVIGGGSHRPLNRAEIAKKVGADVAADYEVTCHDCYSGDLRGFGNLPDGTPLYFNPVVADAEFKVTVGGVYPHGAVGFGGGSKLILPGVAGFATMFHFHTFYASRGHGVIERSGGPPDHRDASEAAAKALGLDIVVNAVINAHREIAGVFVGDFVQAHRAAARFAARTYGTVIPEDIRKEADVVVANVYPLDSDAIQTNKALWVKKYFDNAYTIAVNPASDGIFYHGLFDRIDWRRFSAKLAHREPMADPEPQVNGADQMLVCSENFPIQEFRAKVQNGVLFRDWEELIGRLEGKVRPDAKVVVFPCAGIQILAD